VAFHPTVSASSGSYAASADDDVAMHGVPEGFCDILWIARAFALIRNPADFVPFVSTRLEPTSPVYINPSPFMLACPSLPTMTWS
jgi:hypothetical protein